MAQKTKFYCDWCGEEIKGRGGSKPLFDSPVLATTPIRDVWMNQDVCDRCEQLIRNTLTAALSTVSEACRAIKKAGGKS